MLYLLIASVAVLLIFAALVRRPSPAQVRLFFAVAAAATLADHLFMERLHLYSFDPGLLRHPHADNLLGAILADSLFVPAVVAMVAGRWPRQWLATSVGLSALFTGIEVWFHSVGIYDLHGWQHWYTALAFLVFLAAVQLWSRYCDTIPYHSTVYRGAAMVSAAVVVWHVWGHIFHGILRLAGPLPTGIFVTGAFTGEVYHNLLIAMAGVVIWSLGHAGSLVGTALFAGIVWAGLHALQFARLWHYKIRGGPELATLTLALLFFGLAQLDRWFERQQEERPGLTA